jgi:peptide chain release factor 3
VLAARHQRIENARGQLSRDAGPVIGHLDDHDVAFLPCAGHDGRTARRTGLDGVLVERVKEAAGEPRMSPHAHVGWRKLVSPDGRFGRDFRAGRDQHIDEQDGLGVRGLSAGEGHQIVDDGVSESRIALDLGDVGSAARGILPGEVRARGDDLQNVSQLVRDFGSDLSDRDEALARGLLVYVHEGRLTQRRSGVTAMRFLRRPYQDLLNRRSSAMSEDDDRRLAKEIEQRRTFAIISHPDAGKTTLTEKLLLYGGAIQLAGAVKAKRGRAGAVSDWMEMERERGISITSSVLQFPYRGLHMNLLDTPGHADFSEDTYRTLHAADGAVMLLDCAKGVEAQTKKLFRVCKQRKMPIFTFVNKMDRPGREPFDLIGEVESVLGIGVYPVTWPIYRGATFRGIYHRTFKRVYLFEASRAISSSLKGAEVAPVKVTGIDDPMLREELDEEGYARLVEEAGLLEEAGDAFDEERFLAGEVSPMFFGSAMNNFGLEAFLETFCTMMPSPVGRDSSKGMIAPGDDFSALVFKIQANMDRAHRDRVAFMRVCSGKFDRGMKVLHVRTGKMIRLANPTTFLAQERTIVEEGFAGDVLGIYDPGIFEIGDTLTAGKNFSFDEIPSFAPEHFVRVGMLDPMRRKQLKRGLEQLAQEGTIQLYTPARGGEPILGAVGRLQLEVVKHRLRSEYDVDARLEPMECEFARWVTRDDGGEVDLLAFDRERVGIPALDVRGRMVVLFAGDWQLNSAKREFTGITYAETARGVVATNASA